MNTMKSKTVQELGLNDCLNLTLYDQADPSNLFLATIDNDKFEKMANKQNLVIEQFSLMSNHLQELLNQCQMK